MSQALFFFFSFLANKYVWEQRKRKGRRRGQCPEGQDCTALGVETTIRVICSASPLTTEETEAQSEKGTQAKVNRGPAAE